MQTKKQMPAEYVVVSYHQFEKLGALVWIDGGWGVDALLGKQTRPHSDLDIALEYRFVPVLREHLESQGYKDVPRDDTTKWNFVMGDDNGNQIDFHAFVFDEEGNIIDGLKYPPGSLTGSGTINGQTVQCIDPEHMVKFHSGYELREKDYQDVSALCEKFGIELPQEYARFKQ